ncbi:hypothetical protein CWO90_17595 [Bradyrhizobium sp. Leo121]|nr:hypothetical protein CWO90_17595 [Bradyrhizobium sp. Leo121]
MLTLDGSGASDELRSAFRTLDDAYEALKTAWAERRRVAELSRERERQHPYEGGAAAELIGNGSAYESTS